MRLDLGSVPAWAGALSLLLAFRIFLLDRTKKDRAQVDAVGIWWEVRRQHHFMDQPRVESLETRMLARNGSDLPVELTYVAWEVETRWIVPDVEQDFISREDPWYPGVWSVATAAQRARLFTGPIQIPPGTTIEGPWRVHNIAHLAPEGAVQLEFTSEGVRCILRWALITDNSGRRWQTRHQAGRPARRIRSWSRREADFPYPWKRPVDLILMRTWKKIASLPSSIMGRSPL
jgi:hypothetical protein